MSEEASRNGPRNDLVPHSVVIDNPLNRHKKAIEISRSNAELERATHRMADYALEDFYELTYPMEVLEFASQGLLSGQKREKEAGRMLFNRFDTYLSKNKATTKLLFTPGDSTATPDSINRVADSLVAKIKLLQKRRVSIPDNIITAATVFYSAAKHYEREAEFQQDPTVLAIPTSIPDTYDSALSSDYQRLQDMLQVLCTRGIGQNADGVLRMLQTWHEHGNTEMFPDYLYEKHGGVSFDDIFNSEVPLPNEKIMQFICSLPRGDMMYFQLAGDLLFKSPWHQKWDEDRNPSKAILRAGNFHAFLSQKLLEPALRDEEPDPVFDAQFKDFFQRQLDLSSDIYTELLMGSSSLIQLGMDADKSKSSADIIRENEYLSFFDGLLKGPRKANFTFNFYSVIVENKEKILKSLQERFGDNPRSGALFESFEDIVEINITERIKERFLEDLQTTVGKRFMERIKGGKDEIEKIIDSLAHTVSASPSIKDLPSQISRQKLVSFSENSLPEIIGLKEIGIFQPNKNSGTVDFSFATKARSTPITGAIDIRSNKITIDSDLTDQPELEQLLRFIAVSSMHDMFTAMDTGIATSDDSASHENVPVITQSDEYTSAQKLVIPQQKAELALEKELRNDTTFVKGEALEQLAGLILSYAHPTEPVVPQYCLRVDNDNKTFGTRVDFKVGKGLYEIKWGNSHTNINETVEKHLKALHERENDFEYHLVRFQNGVDLVLPEIVKSQTIDFLLPTLIDNLHMQDMFTELAVSLLESSTNGSSPLNKEFLSSTRDALYSLTQRANTLTPQARQQFIHDNMRHFVRLLEAGDIEEDRQKAIDFANGLSDGTYSPLDAYYEVDGQLMKGKIGVSSFTEESNTFNIQKALPVPSEKPKPPQRNGPMQHISSMNGLFDSNLLMGAVNNELSPGNVVRKIGMHRQLLPGIKEYLPEYLDWYEELLKEQDPTQQKEIREVLMRLPISQPTPEKVAQFPELPSRFHLEGVTTTQDGQVIPVEYVKTGKQMFKDTWYIEHLRPKPEKDEPLSSIYSRHFSGRAALEFLEYVKTWIVE